MTSKHMLTHTVQPPPQVQAEAIQSPSPQLDGLAMAKQKATLPFPSWQNWAVFLAPARAVSVGLSRKLIFHSLPKGDSEALTPPPELSLHLCQAHHLSESRGTDAERKKARRNRLPPVRFQHGPILTAYTCKYLLSQYSHILRCWRFGRGVGLP